MDKTTNAESKPDYASVLSGSSQAPKVEIGTENLLTVNDDEASEEQHGEQPTGCMDNEPEPHRGVPC